MQNKKIYIIGEKLKMKMYVECCQTKDKENVYHALKCDLGYRTIIVSMEKEVCAEMVDKKLSELYFMKPGEKVYVNLNASK